MTKKARRKTAWWDPKFMRKFTQQLLELLPKSGAWVDVAYLVHHTLDLIPTTVASSNYTRWANAQGVEARPELHRRIDIGRRNMITLAATSNINKRLMETNGLRGRDKRLYRLVVAAHLEDDIAWVKTGDPVVRMLPIGSIRVDPQLQTRCKKLNQEVVEQYRQTYEQRKPLPPLLVIQEEDINWLVDGFHRLEARKQAGYPTVECEIRTGTYEQALYYTAKANHDGDHATMKRTNADKRRQVENLLRTRARDLSNARIAEEVGVDDKTVAAVRPKVEVSPSELPKVTPDSEVPNPPKREGKDGKSYPSARTVSTEQERSERQEEVKKNSPRASRIARRQRSWA